MSFLACAKRFYNDLLLFGGEDGSVSRAQHGSGVPLALRYMPTRTILVGRLHGRSELILVVQNLAQTRKCKSCTLGNIALTG